MTGYCSIKTENLIKADWNYKENDEKMLAKLVENIRRNGQIENIIIRELEGGKFEVVNGNHRLDAIKRLNLEEVYCYNLGSISQKQAERIAIETNETRFTSNPESMAMLIAEIVEEYDIDDVLLTLPFNEKEINEMIKSINLEDEPTSTVEEDNFNKPEIGVPIFIKEGDLIEIGRHRLICGDCLQDAIMDKLMSNGSKIGFGSGLKANMVFTDPPYNLDYGSNDNPRHKIRTIENDSMSGDEWIGFNNNIARVCIERNTGDVYIFGSQSIEGEKQRLTLADSGLHMSSIIIWKKDRFVLSPSKYQRNYEPCFYGWVDKLKSSFVGDRKQTDIWEVARPSTSEQHPTMKPIKLCEIGISNSSNPGDIVLDMFIGSGSTMVACEQLDRRCFGVEISPEYCQIIIERMRMLVPEIEVNVNGVDYAECKGY